MYNVLILLASLIGQVAIEPIIGDTVVLDNSGKPIHCWSQAGLLISGSQFDMVAPSLTVGRITYKGVMPGGTFYCIQLSTREISVYGTMIAYKGDLKNMMSFYKEIETEIDKIPRPTLGTPPTPKKKSKKRVLTEKEKAQAKEQAAYSTAVAKTKYRVAKQYAVDPDHIDLVREIGRTNRWAVK